MSEIEERSGTEGESDSTQDERGVITTDKRLVNRLVESMQQHEEIRRGERAPPREFFVDAEKVKEIRTLTGLSQTKFARLLDVDVGTLRNWEQGRRQPTGPARALLRAIKDDHIKLRSSWTKGGRARTVPIRNDEQRRLLEDVRQLARGSALIPPERNYVEHRNRYDRQVRTAGIKNPTAFDMPMPSGVTRN